MIDNGLTLGGIMSAKSCNIKQGTSMHKIKKKLMHYTPLYEAPLFQ